MCTEGYKLQDRVVYQDRVIYQDRIQKVVQEVEVPVDKVVYQDRIGINGLILI